MNDRTGFGPVISQFRKEKGLSQKELAARIIALCDAAKPGPSRPLELTRFRGRLWIWASGG